MRYPLLPPALALAGGIYAARWLMLSEPEYLFWTAVWMLAAGVALRLGRWQAAVTCALLGTALAGACSVVQWTQHRSANNIESLVLDGRVPAGEPARLTGWIRDEQLRERQGVVYLLELESVAALGKALEAQGCVRLQHFPAPGDRSLNLHYGDRVSVLSVLRPVRGFHNPGGFDREARARREGALYTATLKAAELAERLPGRGGWWAAVKVQALRRTLFDRLDRLFDPRQPGNGLLRAMLLGDASKLERPVSEDFQKTGTYHALVVSGLNAGAIAVFLLLMLGALRVPRMAATVLVLSGLAIYGGLSGAGIPIVRAILMFSLYLLARLVFRGRHVLNAVAAAGLILLSLHPADLHDASFQLSFFAVLLIAAVAAPLVQATSAGYRRAATDLDNRDRDLSLAPAHAQFRVELRMFRDTLRGVIPGRLMLLGVRGVLHGWELVLVSLVLQLGFLLPMVLYFHRAAWVSVSANLFVVPLVGIVVPAGLLVLLVALAWPSAAAIMALPIKAIVFVMLAVTRWHAGFDIASLRVPTPPDWLSVFFAACVVVLAAGLLAAWQGDGFAWGRGKGMLAAGGGAGLVVAALLLTWQPFAPRVDPRQLEVVSLDVGQGDSHVVFLPGGRVLLVDTGGTPGGRGEFSTGEQVVAPYLWSRGVRRLDVVTLSHGHEDHAGGLEGLLRSIPVGELWLPADAGCEAYARLARIAREQGVSVRTPRAGDVFDLGNARVDVLWPGLDFGQPPAARNNDSLVLAFHYGKRTALLPGDIETQVETVLGTSAGRRLLADWLKVPHHGSRQSNSAGFLSLVRAPYAVISDGAQNTFGHPHSEVLQRLSAADTRVFRTDRDGAVTWATDGRRVSVQTYEQRRPRLAIW